MTAVDWRPSAEIPGAEDATAFTTEYAALAEVDRLSTPDDV